MKNNYSLDSFTEHYQQDDTQSLEQMKSFTKPQGPSTFTIQKILNYSRALQCHRSESVGMMDHILN